MSMGLGVQTYSIEPEHLIAGVAIGITTSAKEAEEAVVKGAPVLLSKDGKVKKVTASEDSVATDGLYGIVAEDADKGEEAILYLTGEFFADALALEEGVTADALEVAFRNIGIFLK
jgi:phosphopentomutase